VTRLSAKEWQTVCNPQGVFQPKVSCATARTNRSCLLYHRRRSVVISSHPGVEGLPERNREDVRQAVEKFHYPGNLSLGPDYLLSPEELRRLNEEPDSEFFRTPCFAYHVDSAFRERLTDVYRKEITSGSKVLDLCSSFDSHLPPPTSLYVAEVIGHGLSDAELCANPRLSRCFNLDLNSTTDSARFPLENAEVDVVTCCCGIQYLTRPLDVLRECLRVLAPSGTIIVSFSSHAYEAKAVAGWLERSMSQRQQLVERYLQLAGFIDVRTYSRMSDETGGRSDTPATLSDPFFAVTAKRPGIAASRALAEVEKLGGQHLTNNAMEAIPLPLSEQASVEPRYFAAALARWISAYNAMRQEALQMGIPESAVPFLPEYPTMNDVQSTNKLLSAMIASFMSAGL